MFQYLLFLSLYLPFQLALNPSEGIDLASVRVLVILIFFIWLAEGLRKKTIKISNEMQTWLIASFLFISAFSIFFARNNDWSIRKIGFLFSIFPIYFVGRNIISGQKKVLKISKTLVWSGALAATIGIVQFVLQFVVGIDTIYDAWARYLVAPFLGKTFSEAVMANPSWLVGISGHTFLRATSVFPDPHMLAYYLGLLIPLSLGLFLKTKIKAYLGIFFVMLIGDLLTFSRGGYLGLFSGLAFLLVLIWLKTNIKYKLISALAVLFLASFIFVPSPISQRFFSSFNLKEGSNKGRIETWKQALDVIIENPVFGVGIGNYPLAIKPTADYREPIYAHNVYLDIAAETGLLNAIIWIVVLLSTGIYFFRQKDVLYSSLSISFVIYSAHSLVDTPIYSPTVLTLLLIIASFRNGNNYEKDISS